MPKKCTTELIDPFWSNACLNRAKLEGRSVSDGQLNVWRIQAEVAISGSKTGLVARCGMDVQTAAARIPNIFPDGGCLLLTRNGALVD